MNPLYCDLAIFWMVSKSLDWHFQNFMICDSAIRLICTGGQDHGRLDFNKCPGIVEEKSMSGMRACREENSKNQCREGLLNLASGFSRADLRVIWKSRYIFSTSPLEIIESCTSMAFLVLCFCFILLRRRISASSA